MAKIQKTAKRLILIIMLAWILGLLTGGALMYIIMPKYYDSNAGSYNQFYDRTQIFHKNMGLAHFPHVAFHELAHHIWFKRLNETSRREFEQYYERNINSVTEYGSKNAEEDFAERYAFSIMCRAYKPNTDDSDKDEFIWRVHQEHRVVPNLGWI